MVFMMTQYHLTLYNLMNLIMFLKKTIKSTAVPNTNVEYISAYEEEAAT